MNPDNDFLPQLQTLIQSGEKDNIALAIEIASGMGLKERLLQPWKELLFLIYKDADITKNLYWLVNNTELYIKINGLNILPKSIGLLTRLETLIISGNFSYLPAEIAKLSALEVLHLRGNQLKKLPKEIGELKKLRVLNLIDNQIEKLPNTIGELTNLEELYLGNNRLKSLPKSFNSLKNLQCVDLANNFLQLSERSFDGLSMLNKIQVKGSGLRTMPRGINEELKKKLNTIYSEDGTIIQIGGYKGWISIYRKCYYYNNCECPYENTYPCEKESYCWYRYRYDDEKMGFEFSDLLEDAFHQNLKRFKVR